MEENRELNGIIKSIITILLIIGNKFVYGQEQNRFTIENFPMSIGTYYYPEHWPESEWERDLSKMADMGFQFTHYGEFAWAFMEPTEGKYEFEWLDKAISLAANHGLKVILCTPSPTPPVWLTTKYPEVLMKDENDRVQVHGSRQHISWSSKKYREKVSQIVLKLAERYGENENVWGWQIDNEPSHYGVGYDYSNDSQKRFREWLQQKYKTIEALNVAWGTAFWSQVYNSFDQLRIPNTKELPQQPNPHAILDFKRFNSSEATDFIRFQFDILKNNISKNQWITTNLMDFYEPVNPKGFSFLDIVTYTRYMAHGYTNGIGSQGFRLGDWGKIGWTSDFFRPINGNTAVMELQPGQVNWSTNYNPQPYPGAVRMWLWHAYAAGSEFACNYRFRQPLYGGEQYHYGMIGPDGTSISQGGQEYTEVANEMKLLKQNKIKNPEMPATLKARRTAIMWDSDNLWEINNQKQTTQWDTYGHARKYYDALQTFVVPTDIIGPDQLLNEYSVVLAPAYQLVDQHLVDSWKAYVKNGGHLILTTRSGQKDCNGQLWNAPYAHPVAKLIGAEMSFFDHLPEHITSKVSFGSENYHWNNWGEILKPKEGTEIWATYKDQFYKNEAAIVHRKLGNGTITYVGVDTDDGKLEADVLNKVYSKAGIEIEQLPKGIIKRWRDGFWIMCNYTSDVYEAQISENKTIVIGRKEMTPAGIVVWKD